MGDGTRHNSVDARCDACVIQTANVVGRKDSDQTRYVGCEASHVSTQMLRKSNVRPRHT